MKRSKSYCGDKRGTILGNTWGMGEFQPGPLLVVLLDEEALKRRKMGKRKRDMELP